MKGEETKPDLQTIKKAAIESALDEYKKTKNNEIKNFIKIINECSNEDQLFEVIGISAKSGCSGRSSSSVRKATNSLDRQVELDKDAKSKSHDSFEDSSQVDWIKKKSELEKKMLRENNSLKLTFALQKSKGQNTENTRSKLTSLQEFLFILDNCKSQESFVALSKIVEPFLSKSKDEKKPQNKTIDEKLLKKDDSEEFAKFEIGDIKNEQQPEINKHQKVKDNILEKITGNFKKFQSFFDFLREKKYLDIGEVGHFGSRVYKQIIHESSPTKDFPNSHQADFDFFCTPCFENSRGIFVINPDEMAAKINFQEFLREFNERNPSLQISLANEESGKKSVNHGGKSDSLNYKLVATFFEEKSPDDKSEKIVKEQIEFDLNFYTKQSILHNLQWQLNLERVLLTQGIDGNFELKLNQSNCGESKIISIDEFLIKVQECERQNFLLEPNPEAKGFLNRIINKKGVYKYLEDQELAEIKTTLVKDHRLVLEREFEEYKKFLSINKAVGKNPFIDAKIAEYGKIIEAVKKDPILREIAEEIYLVPDSTLTKASTQTTERGAR